MACGPARTPSRAARASWSASSASAYRCSSSERGAPLASATCTQAARSRQNLPSLDNCPERLPGRRPGRRRANCRLRRLPTVDAASCSTGTTLRPSLAARAAAARTSARFGGMSPASASARQRDAASAHKDPGERPAASSPASWCTSSGRESSCGDCARGPCRRSAANVRRPGAVCPNPSARRASPPGTDARPVCRRSSLNIRSAGVAPNPAPAPAPDAGLVRPRRPGGVSSRVRAASSSSVTAAPVTVRLRTGGRPARTLPRREPWHRSCGSGPDSPTARPGRS